VAMGNFAGPCLIMLAGKQGMSETKSPPGRIGQSLIFLLLLPIYILCIPLFVFTKNGKAAFFPVETFPWTSTLQANWRTIRSELDGVLTNLDAVPNFQD